MPLGLVGFDRRQLGTADSLVGIDEAGRGCLAGPVVACAVLCRRDFYATSWCGRNSRMVDDSKRLSAQQRSAVVERFRHAVAEGWIRIGIGMATIAEIEQHNIYHANSLAMRRALQQVMVVTDEIFTDRDPAGAATMPVLIDGKPIRTFPVAHRAVVKGDGRSLAIALAGIHAKQHRDGLMAGLDREYPAFGFGQHKGYGTQQHFDAIRKLGPCPEHRMSFLGNLHGGGQGARNLMQDSLF